MFGIENRRYMGNKQKLMARIEAEIGALCSTKDLPVLLDLFGGTGVVTSRLAELFQVCHVNDILLSNEVIYKAFFDRGVYDMDKLCDFERGVSSLVVDTLGETYISKNYGDKYFSMNDAKQIGYIRELIEQTKEEYTDKEYNVLLASLIYSMDRSAHTVGHYEAFMSSAKQRKFKFELVDPVAPNREIVIHREDANVLAKEIKADVVFIDPPYNSRDYGQYYHVLEQTVKMDDAELHGKTVKPKGRIKSKYCTGSAAEAFKDLVDSLDCKYIVVTYNNSFTTSAASRNKMSYEELTEILSGKGELRVVELNHKAFNTGKTRIDKHIEYLFVVTVS